MVQFGQIPRLIAEAIHPPAQEAAEDTVSGLLKMPRETDSIPAARGEPLSEDDLALLHAVWAHLPPYRDHMTFSEWAPYADAFEHAKHPPDWTLHPLRNSPSLNAGLGRIVAEQEHREALPAAIRTGALMPLSAAMLPIPDAVGDYLLRASVTVQNLREYVARFSIEVQVLPVADPERVPIRALANSLAEELADQHPTGWMKENRDNALRRDCAVSMTQVEIEARIKRMAEERKITPRSPINGLPPGETFSLEPNYYLSAADAERVRTELLQGDTARERKDMTGTETVAVRQDATFATSTPIKVQAIPRQRAQEDEILQAIQQLGYDPKELPKRIRGKPWVKAAAREKVNLTVGVFDKAWERLRADMRINEAS